MSQKNHMRTQIPLWNCMTQLLKIVEMTDTDLLQEMHADLTSGLITDNKLFWILSHSSQSWKLPSWCVCVPFLCSYLDLDTRASADGPKIEMVPRILKVGPPDRHICKTKRRIHMLTVGSRRTLFAFLCHFAARFVLERNINVVTCHKLLLRLGK